MPELPHDTQAESALLGAMLMNNTVIDDVVPIVPSGEAFFAEQHRLVCDTIFRLHGQGKPVDLVTLTGELSGKVDATVIGDLTSATPTSANAAHYARRVAHLHRLREVFHSADRIAREALKTPDPEWLDRAHGELAQVFESAHTSEAVHVGTTAAALVARLREGKAAAGVPLGIPTLDRLTGGWQDGDLAVIAARPSVGKTAFALHCAMHAAALKRPVLIFSLEMDAGALSQRLVAMEGSIPLADLRRNPQNGTLEKIERVSGRLASMPISIVDNAHLTLPQIRAQARRHARRHGKPVVIIDYLQLLRTGRKADARHLEVASISRDLKALARELETPVLALCQLGRSAEAEDDGFRQLAHLRESGAIEQDADLVLILSRLSDGAIDKLTRAHGADRESLASVLECTLAKHRNGPTGKARLRFERECQRFTELSTRPAGAFAS